MWYKAFKKGGEVVTHLPRFGRLSTSKELLMDRKIWQNKKMVIDTRRLSIGEMTFDLNISNISFYKIFISSDDGNGYNDFVNVGTTFLIINSDAALLCSIRYMSQGPLFQVQDQLSHTLR